MKSFQLTRGILPLKLLKERSRLSINFNFENVVGIDPKRLLCDKFNARILLILPSTGGIYPTNLLEERSIPNM